MPPDNIVGNLVNAITDDLKNAAGKWLLPVAGIICVGVIIWGGILYITGGAKGEETAKKTIIAAIIGLLIVSASYVIIKAVITQFP